MDGRQKRIATLGLKAGIKAGLNGPDQVAFTMAVFEQAFEESFECAADEDIGIGFAGKFDALALEHVTGRKVVEGGSGGEAGNFAGAVEGGVAEGGADGANFDHWGTASWGAG